MLRFLERAEYEPETLSAVCHAFDGAWREISYRYESDPDAAMHARHRLAHICLLLGQRDTPSDPKQLQREVLKLISLTDDRGSPARASTSDE